MKFHVLTLFPEMINSGLNYSILKRAVEKNLISIESINIRDFSKNKHKHVDDYSYGGGSGMLMKPEPVYDAYKSINKNKNTRVIYMTPQGERFNQQLAEELSKEEELIILCGHYEGIDERVIEEIVTDEISMGDYILTGGELGAMVLIDSVSRLIKGVLGKEESHQNESFSNNLLEYPQYTRPYEFLGKTVPDVLLSGNHKKIDEWRYQEALKRTKAKRPDMLINDELRNLGGKFMKGIITVLGNDQVGIIAKVCTYLSDEEINILDISQTIVKGYFNMMMIVDISAYKKQSEELAEQLEELGNKIGVVIKFQREDIFNSMHRI